MLKGPKLLPTQWKRLASASSNISQAIIVFSLAAIFVPEVVSLQKDFPKIVGFIYLFWGLLILIGSVILSSKEE